MLGLPWNELGIAAREKFTAGAYPDSGEAFVARRVSTWAWRWFDLRILSGLLAVSQSLPSAERALPGPWTIHCFGQDPEAHGMFASSLSAENTDGTLQRVGKRGKGLLILPTDCCGDSG